MNKERSRLLTEALPKILPQLKGAHYVNVQIRKDGQTRTFEADWLRELVEEAING